MPRFGRFVRVITAAMALAAIVTATVVAVAVVGSAPSLAAPATGAAPAADSGVQHVCSLSPLVILAGGFELTCESVIHDDLSWGSSALWLHTAVGGDWLNAGGGAILLRWYPAQQAPAGVYAGAAFTFLFLNGVTTDRYGYAYPVGGPMFATGAEAGYQWIGKRGIAVNLGAGVQFASAVLNGVSVSAVSPGLALRIGFAW
ncbi:hypothetical protein U7230_07565 [Carboxydochorda subterranea]|uniref:Uncharacterized protein n=1 Tax=Carboxydichorda subterranea TaxID=3109565 RepID=A0ABZ1C1N1_9FIRM|nr:hypothetical protein [Limnochorda sp. L945t]WRP18839.1 hypothetical protein U7230_07565 [Limnochorda sp. L945t]